MSLGPFLRRELITSARRERAVQDRLLAVLLVSAVVAGCVLAWDRWGWDRASVAGAAGFALVAFGLVVAAEGVLAVGIFGQVARAIAAERDRKTLDALLATRLSAAEIVLGTLAAGLVRSANRLAATLPLVVLWVTLGGIDPRLVLLAGAGLAATSFAGAAVAVAVSAGARTASRAINVTAGLLVAWHVLPLLVLTLGPRLWPAGARLLVPVAVRMIESSPLGLWLAHVGVVPRPGGPFAPLWRMIGWQLAGGVLLIAWAVARLRPASRALYDVEGRTLRLRLLRAARRRLPTRPPCGDDPVLWYEVHSTHGASAVGRLAGRVIAWVGLGLVTLVTSWFARPAFDELARRGYGAFPEGFTTPELHPLVRVLANTRIIGLPLSVAPGQARLELNIVLRQLSALFGLFYSLVIFGAASESIEQERKRDTWLGLIATPLTGWEIVRAKMLGPVVRSRGYPLTLIGLWTVGLLAGAVHPLGLLAAVAGLAVSGWFFAALGVALGLWSGALKKMSGNPILWPVQLLAALGAPILLTVIPLVLAWSAPLSYEDVHAAIHAGAFPQFGRTDLRALGARTVVAAWLAGTTALAAGAYSLTRAMCRGFDAAVGRPIRPESPPPHPSIAPGPSATTFAGVS